MAHQKWEYHLELRRRQYNAGWLGGSASDWDSNIPAKLAQLGEEGWELVSISPRSGDPTDNHAGFTTEELWVFKRPKAAV